MGMILEQAVTNAIGKHIIRMRIFFIYNQVYVIQTTQQMIPYGRSADYKQMGEKLETQDLRNAGLKVTLPRVKILEILENSKGKHFSAEDVYKQLLESGEEIGLATVYRVLTQFESAGLVTRHHFDTGHSVFEMDDGSHHDHIVCVRCGRVDEFIDETIEKLHHEISNKAGYKMTDHCLYIYGICADCQKATSK